MRASIIALFLFMTFLFMGISAKSETRIALVIGNEIYKKGPLPNAVSDANLIASTVRRLGFDTKLLLNANRRQIIDAVQNFGAELRGSEKGSIAFFYFAGHGMQIRGKNYLIPIGANIRIESDVEYEAFNIGRLSLMYQLDSKSNNNIAIFDACRDNRFRSIIRSSQEGLAQEIGPGGTIYAYSTSPGRVAADDGAYARSLANYLSKPGISIEQVFRSVNKKIGIDSLESQVPWYLSSLTDDVYLNKNGDRNIIDESPLATMTDPVEGDDDIRDNIKKVFRVESEAGDGNNSIDRQIRDIQKRLGISRKDAMKLLEIPRTQPFHRDTLSNFGG